MEDKNRNLSQEELNLIEETERFMEEVSRNPRAANALPPESAFDELMEKIRKQDEEQELIRLGRIYKKRRSMRKYLILAAALILALALGITSMGGEKISEIFQMKKYGREQTWMDSDDVIDSVNDITEEEVYQEIEDVYGFYPVTFGYLPVDMEFQDAIFSESIHQIAITYQGQEEQRMICRIYLNYNEHTRGKDIEDEVSEVYCIELPEATILLKEHEVEGDTPPRWTVEFTYQDAHYIYTISGIEKEEVEKIVENLSFS